MSEPFRCAGCDEPIDGEPWTVGIGRGYQVRVGTTLEPVQVAVHAKSSCAIAYMRWYWSELED